VAFTSYLWQVALHSVVMGVILYAWAHRLRLPSGRTKRRLLGLLLVLPIFTAAVPGRTTIEFGERVAWLNSARILAVPLPGGFQLWHAVLAFAAVFAAVTIWQEVLPSFERQGRSGEPAPDAVVALARSLPGWDECAIVVTPREPIVLATGGVPGRPRLFVSRGALATLTPAQLGAVVRHEHAHWVGGRWWWSHALFGARLLQCGNPVALWVFREYCLEVEIDCDAIAVAGRDASVLARVLLGLYDGTDTRDVAARQALRRRVDVLLAGGPTDVALPTSTVLAVSAVMLVVLPWIV
jgi:Zn-dependent protease with chaperone function